MASIALIERTARPRARDVLGRSLSAAVLVIACMAASVGYGVHHTAYADETLRAGAIASGDTFSVDSFSYKVNDDTATVTVTGFSGTATGNLSIPATVTYNDGTASKLYTVTAIGDRAFYGKSGFNGTLSLPSAITSIGASAFEGCSNLAGTLSLPASLTTLGERAFQNCECLGGTLTIPAGVTAIPDNCFYNSSNSHDGDWTGLTGVKFASGSTLQSIGDYAFAGNWHMTGGLSFPATVTSIGAYAFNCTGMRMGSTNLDEKYGEGDGGDGYQGTLTLPSGLQSIGESAFYACNFRGNLVIPNSAVTLGAHAFENAGFYGGSLTLKEGMKAISDGCFERNAFTGTLALPSTLTSIGDSAFSNNKGFTGALTIPKSVTSIEAYAFAGCSGFNSTLDIPAGVESIGDSAFSGFGSEAVEGKLTLRAGLKSIGASAFEDCSQFVGALTLPDTVETIGRHAFMECKGFTSLKLPDNDAFTTIPDCAFGSQYWGTYGSYNVMGYTGELVIPDSVTSIGEEAFHACQNFTGTLSIPDGVTSIGDNAFNRCSGFTGLSLPSAVKTIGEGAFRRCGNMSCDVVIPETVESIGEEAFMYFGSDAAQSSTLSIEDGANALIIEDEAFANGNFKGSVTIPNRAAVGTFGDDVFSSCVKLTGFSLPDNWTSVPEGMFRGCTGIVGAIQLPTSVTSIETRAFVGCTGISGNLVIPENVTSIGNYSFENCTGLNGTLSLPSALASIGYEAFSGCENLTGSLNLPDNLTSLGSNAFANCKKLTGDVTIPAGVTKLESDLFVNCEGLTGSLTIPESAQLRYSYSTPLRSTRFSTIANNSAIEFSGPELLPSGVAAYYVDASGAKTETIGTGTYQLRTYDSTVDISGAQVSAVPDYTFARTYLRPEPTVTLNGETLEKDAHYKLSYSNNYYVGTATVYVRGYAYNGYTGEVKQTFKILSTTPSTIDISSATVTVANQTYTGKALTPAPTVTIGSTTLKAGTDYTVAYGSNTNAGTASVTVTGTGTYTGTATGSFTINKAASTIALKAQSKTFNGKAQAYTGTVTKTGSTGKVTYQYYSNATCTKAVKAANVKNAGTYYVKATVAANANYKAATSNKAVKFTIKKASQTITANNKSVTMGKTVALAAKASANGKLTYASSNDKIAKVNAKGTVTPVKVGKATITIKAAETTNYAATSKKVTVTVTKGANPLAVKAKTATVKLANVKKKNQVLAVSKVMTFTKKGAGTLTYTKKSGNKKIVINKKTGKVTVKKGLAKGTYKVSVAVKAAGNANWKPATKTITFKVKVA